MVKITTEGIAAIFFNKNSTTKKGQVFSAHAWQSLDNCHMSCSWILAKSGKNPKKNQVFLPLGPILNPAQSNVKWDSSTFDSLRLRSVSPPSPVLFK